MSASNISTGPAPPLRVVFMGTPEFAVPCLQSICEGPDTVVGVISQPDKPAGRRLALKVPPVKVFALDHRLPVFQPESIRAQESVDQLNSWKPDIIVVVAYGKMLPNDVLSLPPRGCVNVHASLLPKFRGAAPIQWAIAQGETYSGVTIMQISETMDAGDILLKVPLRLAQNETGGTLHDKLSKVGATGLQTVLKDMKKGVLEPATQDDSEVTYAPALKKEDGRIKWAQSAEHIERCIRAFDPWPSAYTLLGEKRLKGLGATLVDDTRDQAVDASPGMVQWVGGDIVTVATGNGMIGLSRVQLQGKKAMHIGEFLKGMSINKGATFH